MPTKIKFKIHPSKDERVMFLGDSKKDLLKKLQNNDIKSDIIRQSQSLETYLINEFGGYSYNLEKLQEAFEKEYDADTLEIIEIKSATNYDWQKFLDKNPQIPELEVVLLETLKGYKNARQNN